MYIHDIFTHCAREMGADAVSHCTKTGGVTARFGQSTTRLTRTSCEVEIATESPLSSPHTLALDLQFSSSLKHVGVALLKLHDDKLVLPSDPYLISEPTGCCEPAALEGQEDLAATIVDAVGSLLGVDTAIVNESAFEQACEVTRRILGEKSPVKS